MENPKNMTVGSNSPSGVIKVAFHWSSSLNRMLLYPHHMSNLVKRVESFMLSISSGIKGKGYAFRTVWELRYW